MDKGAALRLITTCREKCYSDPKRKPEKAENGWESYTEKSGVSTYVDQFIGSKTFIGAETLVERDQIIWVNQYSGEQYNDDEKVYKFLKEALAKGPDDVGSDFRGPIDYRNGDYRFMTQLARDGFYVESIYHNDIMVYECRYWVTWYL